MDKPIIYVTTEYDPSKAEEALRERGLGNVESSLLNFVDAYNDTVGISVSDRQNTIQADCNNLSSIEIAIQKLSERIGGKDFLLVFDSLTSPYLFNGSEILRFIRETLSRFASRGNSVMTCIDEGCGKPEDLVAMMSLSDGVIKIETKENKRLFSVVKHPRVRPVTIEIPRESKRTELRLMDHLDDIDAERTRQFLQAYMRGDEAWMRKEVGDFVNLFWPNLVHWSGMLWDSKRFPIMKYELNKEDESEGAELIRFYPWYRRLMMKFYELLLAPENLSKVKDMERMVNYNKDDWKRERSGIVEYLSDVSRTDEHYIRIYENSDCWGFENVGAPMALYIPSAIAGISKGFEGWRGLDREWNAVETKCIGLGDPYCEVKFVPGEIDELESFLEKDNKVLEKIHEQLMSRLMGFFFHGKSLVERPMLGSDVHFHVVMHTFGFPNFAGERYQMALRMGGAKTGKEIGEHLMDTGMDGDTAAKCLVNLLEYCKVGKVSLEKTIRIKENCESMATMASLTKRKRFEESSCFFTTGFLNGFFSTVKNQHVKETKCIAMGDPHCEWAIR
jgi:predicted hydrocarbon binding protein/KaiC/GvpD/RAD55 family RecA-like ATPase